MLITEKKTGYTAFGLTLTSEIPLPELRQIEMDTRLVDVEIEISDISNRWIERSEDSDQFIIEENMVMFQIPNIAIFLIQDGCKITVTPSNGCEEGILRLLLLGTCMGAILMQRRILPLHGSAVAINGRAYAIVGESGAGKSTLATALIQEGYSLLSDDVVAVTLPKSGPMVTPSYPQQKLWEDSLQNFGMEKSGFQSIYGRKNKYCVPIAAQFYQYALPLAGIFELIKSDHHEVFLRQFNKLESVHALYRHTYRNFFIPSMGLLQWHFDRSVKIANHIKFYQLFRPGNGFSSMELRSVILETINGGNIK